MGVESGGESFSGGRRRQRRISGGGDCIFWSERRMFAGEMLGVSACATSRVQAESSLYCFVSQGQPFFPNVSLKSCINISFLIFDCHIVQAESSLCCFVYRGDQSFNIT